MQDDSILFIWLDLPLLHFLPRFFRRRREGRQNGDVVSISPFLSLLRIFSVLAFQPWRPPWGYRRWALPRTWLLPLLFLLTFLEGHDMPRWSEPNSQKCNQITYHGWWRSRNLVLFRSILCRCLLGICLAICFTFRILAFIFVPSFFLYILLNNNIGVFLRSILVFDCRTSLLFLFGVFFILIICLRLWGRIFRFYAGTTLTWESKVGEKF